LHAIHKAHGGVGEARLHLAIKFIAFISLHPRASSAASPTRNPNGIAGHLWPWNFMAISNNSRSSVDIPILPSFFLRQKDPMLRRKEFFHLDLVFAASEKLK